MAQKVVSDMKNLINTQRRAGVAIQVVEKEQQRRKERRCDTRHKPPTLVVKPLRAISLHICRYIAPKEKETRVTFFDHNIYAISAKQAPELRKEKATMRDVWNTLATTMTG